MLRRKIRVPVHNATPWYCIDCGPGSVTRYRNRMELHQLLPTCGHTGWRCAWCGLSVMTVPTRHHVCPERWP